MDNYNQETPLELIYLLLKYKQLLTYLTITNKSGIWKKVTSYEVSGIRCSQISISKVYPQYSKYGIKWTRNRTNWKIKKSTKTQNTRFNFVISALINHITPEAHLNEKYNEPSNWGTAPRCTEKMFRNWDLELWDPVPGSQNQFPIFERDLSSLQWFGIFQSCVWQKNKAIAQEIQRWWWCESPWEAQSLSSEWRKQINPRNWVGGMRVREVS